MALNAQPNALESAFVQRDPTNTYYDQINISGSDLIIYHDSTGTLTADKVNVWATRYGIGQGTFAGSASYASRSLSSSYAATASYALNAAGGGVATASIYSSQSLYSTQSLFATQSFYSTQSLYAFTAGNATNTTYSIQSEYATQSLYATQSTYASFSLTAASASWTSESSTTDTVQVFPTKNNGGYYVTFVQSTGTQIVYIDTSSIVYNPSTDLLTVNHISSSNITSSLYGTASVAFQSITASYVSASAIDGQIDSSSFASTASVALYALSGTGATTGSLAFTASIGMLSLDPSMTSSVPFFSEDGHMSGSNITVTNGGTIKVNARSLQSPPQEHIFYIGRDGNTNTWAASAFYNDAGGLNAKYWLNYADQVNQLQWAAVSDDFAIVSPWLTVVRSGSAITQILFKKDVTTDGNYMPSTNLSQSLGTGSYQWKNAWISNVYGTASWAATAITATSASFASRSLSSTIATSASWASQSLTSVISTSSSFASSSISASNVMTASYALVALTVSGTIDSATIAISASFASSSISASVALTSSYTLGSVSSATYALSASWASSSLSSSVATSASYASASTTASYTLYAANAGTASLATKATIATSASFASQSISASWTVTASYVLLAVGASSQSLYATQSLFATQSIYASSSLVSTSASFASQSISSSYAVYADTTFQAVSASYAPVSGVVTNAETASFAFTASIATSASYAANVPDTASYATHAALSDTASYAMTASVLLGSVQNAAIATSASFASSSISASYAKTSSIAVSSTLSTYATSASWASSSVSASNALTAAYPWALNSLGNPYHNTKTVLIGTTTPNAGWLTVQDSSNISQSVMSVLGQRTDTVPTQLVIRNLDTSSPNAYAEVAVGLGNIGSLETGRVFFSRAATPAYGIVSGINITPMGSNQDIGFRTGVALSGSVIGPQLQLKSTGLVGIGVATPVNARLHIGGSDVTYYNATLRLTNGAAGGGDFYFAATDNNWGFPAANKLIIGLGDPSNIVAKMQIDGNTGFFGMGLSASITPGANLHVAGNISASSVTASFFAGTASWADNAFTASFAPSSTTASYVSASSIDGTPQVALSASWASQSNVTVTSSFSTTASYALNGGGSTLTTGSDYPITASWADNAVSASYAPGNPAISSSYAITASWAYTTTTADFAALAGQAITASFAYSTFAQGAVSASNSNTASVAFIAYNATTASYASSSISSSNATTSSYALSSSISSNAVTASFALTASLALNGGTTLVTGSTYPITASWAQTASIAITSSFSNTASYALNSGTSLTTGSTYPITASWANTASFALTASSLLGVTGSFLVTGSILLGGKLGIGTFVNTHPLDISTTGSGTSIYLSNFSSTAYNEIDFWNGSSLAGLGKNGPTSTNVGGGPNPGSAAYFFNDIGDFAFRTSGSIYFINGAYGASASIVLGQNGKVGFGILNPTNSLDVVGNISASVITASLFFGTASIAITASYALNGGGSTLTTGSTYPITASWAQTASIAISASYAPSSPSISASYAFSASYAPGSPSISASYATTASYVSASSVDGIVSQSYFSQMAVSADVAFLATVAISSSYALTASVVLNGAVGGGTDVLMVQVFS